MPQFSHASYSLHPAEDFFPPLALLLADRVTRMPCRPAVNGARASLIILRHVRSGVHVPRLFDEIVGVVGFIGSNGNGLIPWDLFNHHQRRIAFRSAVGPQYFDT